jgi:hypothetical protein
MGFLVLTLLSIVSASFQFSFLSGSRDLNVVPTDSQPGGVDTQVSLVYPKLNLRMAALGYGPDCNGQVGWLNVGWVDAGKGWSRFPQSSSCTRNATSSPSLPGARSGAAWIGLMDNHQWLLFGGYGTGAHPNRYEGKLADMWLFDAASMRWRYIAGPTEIESVANYTGPGAWPGSRVGAVFWQDPDDQLYLTLGWGLASIPGKRGGLSDVWRLEFDKQWRHPTWTFVEGPQSVNNPGTNRSISGRYGVTHWSAKGCLFIYGGHGIDASGKDSFLSSLYSFCGPKDGWQLIHGSLEGNLPPVYGELGVWSKSNSPGSRYGAVALSIGSGDDTLYLFGGSGAFSDIWGYNLALGMWAWLAGPKGTGFLGATDWPSGRRDCTQFPINSTHLTLSAGYGYGPQNSTVQGGLSDMWLLKLLK